MSSLNFSLKCIAGECLLVLLKALIVFTTDFRNDKRFYPCYNVPINRCTRSVHQKIKVAGKVLMIVLIKNE